MRAIFGIGNPGRKYQRTRHNIGMIILESIASRYGLSFTESKNNYLIANGCLSGSRFCLIKPTTYVNNSGIAAREVIDSTDISLEDFFVVVDDINLGLGNIRIRISGGDGGHNGLHSIIYHLKSEDFPRLRFGIGSNFESGRMADYVLSKFRTGEEEILKQTTDFSISVVEAFIKEGIQSSLNHYSKEIGKLKSNSDIQSN